jgi:nucleoid DNA-binding protein
MKDLQDYKSYKEWCRSEGATPINKKLYRRVIRLSNKGLFDALVQGHVLKLPYGLGELFIHQKPRPIYVTDKNTGERILNPKLPVNFKATKEARQKDPKAPLVYHTDRKSLVRYLTEWVRFRCRFSARKYYVFRPGHGLLKAAAAAGRSGQAIYHRL